MRLTEARFERDLARYRLALRLLRWDARNRTIQRWTGLSMHRVRTLRASAQDPQHPGIARRGVMPYQPAVLLRSGTVKSEAAVLAGFLFVFGVIPSVPLAHPERDLPDLARGLRLCDAYAQFIACVPQSRLTIEHAMLLLTQWMLSTEITIDRCPACDALMLVDRLAATRRCCVYCECRGTEGDKAVAAEPALTTRATDTVSGRDSTTPQQGSLF